MDLPKTTAFVSGANRGLGKHLADQLTSRGAGVHGGSRKPGTLDTSTGVIPVQLDITDPASVTAAAARTATRVPTSPPHAPPSPRPMAPATSTGTW
jgi:NAD(P)-dependent dehydrogenase (short-subunit alcohol dehydrogenase family)